MLIFVLIEMLSLEFSSELEFLRRALIAPDVATAGGSSLRLCMDRACPRLMLPFHGSSLHRTTQSKCDLGFGHLHAQLEV